MYQKLLSMLKKTALWQRSPECFWRDTHISKGLLEMHLNPHLELASRRADTIEKSVKWLSSIIKGGSTILDLGCGPGLYAKRLSALGYSVTGIDFSKNSINYAKVQDATSNYIYQNYLDMDFAEVFDVVLLIYCDFAALTMDERQRLLKKIHRALKPNGIFICDVFTEHSQKNKVKAPTWTFHKQGGFWSHEPYLCLETTHLYELERTSADQYIIITEKAAKEYTVWNTIYDLDNLSEEICPHGFTLISSFDDVCGKPYTGKSETLCVIMNKGATHKYEKN